MPLEEMSTVDLLSDRRKCSVDTTHIIPSVDAGRMYLNIRPCGCWLFAIGSAELNAVISCETHRVAIMSLAQGEPHADSSR